MRELNDLVDAGGEQVRSVFVHGPGGVMKVKIGERVDRPGAQSRQGRGPIEAKPPPRQVC